MELGRQNYHYLKGNVDLYGAGTNDFTGSASLKEGTVGAFADKFNYKVYLKVEDKKPVRVIASWYIGCFSIDNTDPELITTNEFEPSEDGTSAAFDWLQREYENSL